MYCVHVGVPAFDCLTDNQIAARQHSKKTKNRAKAVVITDIDAKAKVHTLLIPKHQKRGVYKVDSSLVSPPSLAEGARPAEHAEAAPLSHELESVESLTLVAPTLKRRARSVRAARGKGLLRSNIHTDTETAHRQLALFFWCTVYRDMV